MLDAANLAKLSWDNVSRMTIARCWVKGFREAVRRSNANATRQLLITEIFLIMKVAKLELAPLEIAPKFSFEPMLGGYPGATGIPAGIFHGMTNTRVERETFAHGIRYPWVLYEWK